MYCVLLILAHKIWAACTLFLSNISRNSHPTALEINDSDLQLTIFRKNQSQINQSNQCFFQSSPYQILQSSRYTGNIPP